MLKVPNNNVSSNGNEMDIPMDDTLSNMNQEIGNEEQLSDTEVLPTGMEEEMPMGSMENDKTMEIINKLSDKDKAKLRKAMAESSDTVKIDLTDLAEKKKQMIYEITRGNLDEATIDQLCKIINQKKGEGK